MRRRESDRKFYIAIRLDELQGIVYDIVNCSQYTVWYSLRLDTVRCCFAKHLCMFREPCFSYGGDTVEKWEDIEACVRTELTQCVGDGLEDHATCEGHVHTDDDSHLRHVCSVN